MKTYYFNFSISGEKSALNTEWNCHDFYLLLYYSLWISGYIEYRTQYNLSRFCKIWIQYEPEKTCPGDGVLTTDSVLTVRCILRFYNP